MEKRIINGRLIYGRIYICKECGEPCFTQNRPPASGLCRKCYMQHVTGTPVERSGKIIYVYAETCPACRRPRFVTKHTSKSGLCRSCWLEATPKRTVAPEQYRHYQNLYKNNWRRNLKGCPSRSISFINFQEALCA